MNKDSSDFMTTEYDRISTAYFDLRDQVNEWFKTYVTLISLPLTVLVAVTKIGEDSNTTNFSTIPPIVSILLIVVAFLGFFVNLSIVSMRMEMILYARTINGIRRFFAELGQNENSTGKIKSLAKFLILPTSDKQPPFYESGRAMFWQVCMIGFLDALIFLLAIQNLTSIGWFYSSVIGFLFGLTHWFIYWIMAFNREKKWQIRFTENLANPNT
jgi:hypothetical protein